MAKEKKSLGRKEIEAIANIIHYQSCLYFEPHEQDPDGLVPFTNMIACRNIRDNLFKYLEKVLHEDVIPFELSYELTEKGKDEFRKKHGIGRVGENWESKKHDTETDKKK